MNSEIQFTNEIGKLKSLNLAWRVEKKLREVISVKKKMEVEKHFTFLFSMYK